MGYHKICSSLRYGHRVGVCSLLTLLSPLLSSCQAGSNNTANTQAAKSFVRVEQAQVELGVLADRIQEDIEATEGRMAESRGLLEERLGQKIEELGEQATRFDELEARIDYLRDLGTIPATPPTSVGEYLHLAERLELLEEELGVLKQLQEAEQLRAQDLLKLRESLASVRNTWSKLLSYDLKEEALRNAVLLSQENLELAQANN